MFVRGQNIILRRTLSAIITLAFSISNLEIPTVEAEISASTGRLGSSIIQEIKIPTKWGDIVSRFEGDSKQLIIQIQDAHCNFEAQSNTARILEELFKKYGKELKVVNVEGSSGVLDTSALTLFPDREIKKQLALYYLKKGKISGAEYLSIIKEEPLELQGVEDLGLYFQNLKWFDRSLELREKADELIKGIQKVLNELQEPVFNDELKQFLRSEEAYEKGKTNLVEHLTLLKRMGEKKNVKTKDLKNVNLFLKVEEESQAIKFEEVEKERTALVEKLLPLLSKEESAKFLTQNLYFRLGKIEAYEYFSALGKLIKKKGIEDKTYRNLAGYIGYLKDFNRIDRGKFSDELKVWAKRILESLFKNDEEQQLVRRTEEIKFLRNFYHLELTREDLKFYNQRKDKINAQAIGKFLLSLCEKHKVKQPSIGEIYFLEEHLSSLEKFYEVAVKRDAVMVAKTLKGLKNSRKKIAILIAGGFHSEGIRAKLRDEGVSYVVLSPRITNLEAKSPYIEVMEDERSTLEEVFQKQLMNGETAKRLSRYRKTIHEATQTVNPMSPFQEGVDLVALFSQEGVDKRIVRRKFESANLFTLVPPSLLKILSSIKDDAAWKEIFQVWKSRVKSRITDVAKRKGISRADQAVTVESVEPVKERTFIRLKISGEPFGVIVDQKAIRSAGSEPFELEFKNETEFERERRKALGPESLKSQNTWKIYFEEVQRVVERRALPVKSSPPPKTGTVEMLRRPPSGAVFLSDQDKEKLRDLLKNNYTESEVKYLPDDKSLIKILKYENVTPEIWKKCLDRERFLRFEKGYNNDKFASYILAVILIPIGFFLHFSPSLAERVIELAHSSFIEAAIRLLQFHIGSAAEGLLGLAGLGVFAGMFWVSIKTFFVHGFIFGFGGFINRQLTKTAVKKFEDLVEVNLSDYVEEYRRRKKNVIPSTKVSKFERPLQHFFRDLLTKLLKDLPKYDEAKGRKDQQTTRYLISSMFPDVDVHNKSVEELIEIAKKGIQASPERRFRRMLIQGVTLGLIQEITNVSELDRDIYYAYLERLQSLNPNIYESYLKIRKDFEPIEIFSKIRIIFSEGLNKMSKQDLVTIAILFKLFNGAEQGLAEQFVARNFKDIPEDEIKLSVQNSAEKLTEAGILDENKLSGHVQYFTNHFRGLVEMRPGLDVYRLTESERDIVFFEWARKIVALKIQYPRLSELLEIALDDIPDASWIGNGIFELVSESGGSIERLKRLIELRDQHERLKMMHPNEPILHNEETILQSKRMSPKSNPPGPIASEDRPSLIMGLPQVNFEPQKEQGKGRRILNWALGGILTLITVGGAGYMLGRTGTHSTGTPTETSTSVPTRITPSPSVSTTAPNVSDFVTIDRTRPITALSFNWAAIPADYFLRVEMSADDFTAPGGSVTPYELRERTQTSFDPMRTTGHRYIRLTLVSTDPNHPASAPVIAPLVPQVTMTQAADANRLTWTRIDGVNSYRVELRNSANVWGSSRPVTTSSMDFSRDVNRARITPIFSHGGRTFEGPPAEIDITPIAPPVVEPLEESRTPRPAPRPSPRPRPSSPNPVDLLRAPLRTGKVEGKEKEADFGKLKDGKFVFHHRIDGRASINDGKRFEYQEKIREALAFLSQYQDLSDVNLPVTFVEDLDTWMDFGHEKDLLRIDTDALSGKNYSPQALALLLSHEIAHARGANEFEAVKQDLALYRKITESGKKFPEALLHENAYFAFLENNYSSMDEKRDSAIRSYLWRLEFSRSLGKMVTGIQGFLNRGWNRLGLFSNSLKEALLWLGERIHPVRVFKSLMYYARAILLASIIAVSSSLVLALPSPAFAQETDMNSRIHDGYRLSVATDRIPEDQVLVIQTCGAANCNSAGGRESYSVHRGDEGHVWLSRSRGHRYIRLGFHEVRGRDEWGREDLRLVGAWTGPFSVTLTIPASAPAPGNLAFNAGTRRLTWNRVADVRGYLVEAFDSTASDDSRTLTDERWISLGEIAQGDNPGIDITRANLTRVRVIGVRGGRGGEVRGAVSEIPLDSYTIPAAVSGSSSVAGTGDRVDVPDLGYVLRMPGSYTLNLTPQDGVTEYRVYTSDSQEALEALRQFFITGDESHRTRARELGYQEYNSRNPNDIQLRNSYGHDYILIRPRTGSGDAMTDGAPSSVALIGSRTMRDTDAYFRIAYHGGFTGWNSPLLQFDLALREATLGMFLPGVMEPFGRPLRLEGSYRRSLFVADDSLRFLNLSTLTLATRYHVSHRFPDDHQITFSVDPQAALAITPIETFAGIFRLPYDLRATLRASPDDSFELGLGGEARLAVIDGLGGWDFFFDTRSGDQIGNSGIPMKRFARDTELLYSRILWSPSFMYRHRFSPEARLSLGARYDDEVTIPWAHTLWGVAELELPTGFRLAGQFGHTWDEHLTDPDKNPVGRSLVFRGGLSWRPTDVFGFGFTDAYRFVDGEHVAGGNLTFYLPGSYAITADVQYLARKSGFEEGIVSFIGFQGALDLPIYRERAPLVTGRESGQESDLDSGIIRSGKFFFDEDRAESSGLSEKHRSDYEKRINEALEFLGRYVDLAGIEHPVTIVEDLDTWMDFSHETDQGVSSGFGIERGMLRIDTDAIKEGKYVKEAVALLLNHELTHARGADEMGAILSDLAFYRRLKEESPDFIFPNGLREEHRYFEFLEEYYALDPEDQVQAVKVFLVESGFVEPGRTVLKMNRQAAEEYGNQLRRMTEIRKTLEQVKGFYDGIQRDALIGLVQQGVSEFLKDDVISDHQRLKNSIGLMIGELTNSNISLGGFIDKVKKIVDREEARDEELLDFDNIQGVAVAFLLIANFLRGGKVSPGTLERIVEAYLEDRRYEGKILNDMKLDEIITLFGDEDKAFNGDLEWTGNLNGFKRIVDYFKAIEALKLGKTEKALTAMKHLEKGAQVEEGFERFIEGTQTKILKIQEDGTLEIAGREIEISELSQEFLESFHRVVRGQREEEGPIYIDFIGGGYIHPDRFNKILKTVLENPEKLKEGFHIEKFLGRDEEGNWGYEDGTLVKVRLVGDVIQFEVQSLAERYEELRDKIQSRIIGKMKGWKKPQVLVSTGKTFGIEIQRDEKGKMVVKTQAEDFRKFYGQVLNMMKSGENTLKLAIPVVLSKNIAIEEANEELILRSLFGEELYTGLKERLKQEIYVQFYSHDHSAVQSKELGTRVWEDVINGFNQRGVVIDSQQQMTFVVSELEQDLYRDLRRDFIWIVEGKLDAKKLLLIAEHLSSNGIKDQELLEFLRKADPEAIDEMNRRQMTNPKVMMEDFDLRIKSEKQTETMA